MFPFSVDFKKHLEGNEEKKWNTNSGKKSYFFLREKKCVCARKEKIPNPLPERGRSDSQRQNYDVWRWYRKGRKAAMISPFEFCRGQPVRPHLFRFRSQAWRQAPSFGFFTTKGSSASVAAVLVCSLTSFPLDSDSDMLLLLRLFFHWFTNEFVCSLTSFRLDSSI